MCHHVVSTPTWKRNGYRWCEISYVRKSLLFSSSLYIVTYSNGLHVSYLQCYAWCVVLLNGFNCKDPKMVNASDFSSSGLHITGNTSNPVGSRVTPMTATNTRPQFFWHFPCPYWLCTMGYQPSPQSPSCHRNLNCLGG